ncbi:MAG: HAMP domain-containing protein, partial [Desulfobulbaceae bacterium]|nr:HAMP domain-containing protein [Desulfobulbaceae bacterium]
MRNQRLLWQIFPAILLITLGAMLIVTWFATATIRTFYYQEMRNDIEARALLLEQEIVRLANQSPEDLRAFCRQAGRRAATRITVVESDGTVLADSNEDHTQMDNHAGRPELKEALAGHPGSSVRFSKTIGQEMLYVAIPIVFEASRAAGALRLSVPSTALDAVLTSIRGKILIGSLLAVVLAGLLALYSARRISRPLEEMKKGAEQLSTGKIDQLQISSEHMSTEMAGLAASLNRMSEQINDRVKTVIQQRNELEAVFSSMAELVVAIDSKEQIIRMNKAAKTVFGLDPEAVKGKAMQGVIRNADLLHLIRRTLRDNASAKKEIILFEGSNRMTLQTHAVPLRNDDNTIMGALIVMNDLTRINQLENIRQDFVANVSHELKTPITAIKGYVETLLDGALENKDDAEKFLQVVSKQTKRLEAIVNDLLTLSRIENMAGQGKIHLSLENIRMTLEAARQTCSVGAEENNITMHIECDGNLEARVNRPLLEQAVINLLNNAITYSSKNSTVTIRARRTQTVAGKKIVQIRVEDKGAGIASEHLPRLFERFYRCDKSRSREQGGTGLGLAIVKHIAQSHGGSADVESNFGKGSTFTLT